ncbi:MAG: hypothetical protein KDI36_19020, partial [Pseudomonadales bacterium]|nr:hypothetical protein [Pseudomonadales bacterium]
YVAGFSHELVLTEDSALVKAGRNGGGGESGLQTGELLKAALPHLNVVIYRARMDLAIRMGSAALGNYARQKNAFKGTGADFFVENLIDSMEGLLSAPVSKNTKSLQV